MCRFLLAKFSEPTSPKIILEKFSSMAKKSKAHDGDWQGDGWGVSWLDTNNYWKTRKSLLPIWEEKSVFTDFPKTQSLAIHARSASFPDQKGIIEYNQPFVDEPYLFVFNGLLKGVSLSSQDLGKIGSQKIWFLLRKMLDRMTPSQALKKIKEILLKNSRNLQSLNIGLSDKKNIYSLCYFSKYREYYQLQYLNNPQVKIICSEKVEGYTEFRSLEPGKFIEL